MSKGKPSVKVIEGDNYRCASCGKRIPKGTRYWSIPTAMGGERHEHLNCGEVVDPPDPDWSMSDPTSKYHGYQPHAFFDDESDT